MAAKEPAEIAPVDFEEDGAVRGAIFDVPLIGEVTVWPDVFELHDAAHQQVSPEDLEDAARHLMAAAAWMRKENGEG